MSLDHRDRAQFQNAKGLLPFLPLTLFALHWATNSHKNFHMTLICLVFLDLNWEFLGIFFKLVFTLDWNNRTYKLATALPRYSFENLLFKRS